jgi:hypothetical protein
MKRSVVCQWESRLVVHTVVVVVVVDITASFGGVW